MQPLKVDDHNSIGSLERGRNYIKYHRTIRREDSKKQKQLIKEVVKKRGSYNAIFSIEYILWPILVIH